MRIQGILLLGLMVICSSCTDAPPETPAKTQPKIQPDTQPKIQPDTQPATQPKTAIGSPTTVTDDVPLPPVSAKIELDLTKLDANGLRGPPSGKVLVSYEFCIPKTDKCKAEVKAIDKSVRFMGGSRGRIGARKDQYLCIGETGPDYKTVLERLAALSYVKRIIECHWE